LERTIKKMIWATGLETNNDTESVTVTVTVAV
jgi:hypothetical protein